MTWVIDLSTIPLMLLECMMDHVWFNSLRCTIALHWVLRHRSVSSYESAELISLQLSLGLAIGLHFQLFLFRRYHIRRITRRHSPLPNHNLVFNSSTAWDTLLIIFSSPINIPATFFSGFSSLAFALKLCLTFLPGHFCFLFFIFLQ